VKEAIIISSHTIHPRDIGKIHGISYASQNVFSYEFEALDTQRLDGKPCVYTNPMLLADLLPF